MNLQDSLPFLKSERVELLEDVENFDEGLGTVYERFMLNSFFDSLIDSYSIEKVLEVPFYGMTGLSGINSVHFVRRGCKLTLVDSKKEKVDETIKLWGMLPYNGRHEIIYQDSLSQLPFADRSFDIVWNFAALWHVKEAEALLSEMARVSSNLILVFMPNRLQIGYLLRKYLLDRDFFSTVDERWTVLKRVEGILKNNGLRRIGEGVLDVPPWPDTCIPLKSMIKGMGLEIGSAERKGLWRWDIMEYYSGRSPELKERVEKYSFLEGMPVNWRLKTLWAHHRYMLFSKN